MSSHESQITERNKVAPPRRVPVGETLTCRHLSELPAATCPSGAGGAQVCPSLHLIILEKVLGDFTMPHGGCRPSWLEGRSWARRAQVACRTGQVWRCQAQLTVSLPWVMPKFWVQILPSDALPYPIAAKKAGSGRAISRGGRQWLKGRTLWAVRYNKGDMVAR